MINTKGNHKSCQKALNMEIIQTDGYYNVFPYSIQEVTYNYLGTQTLPKENNKK